MNSKVDSAKRGAWKPKTRRGNKHDNVGARNDNVGGFTNWAPLHKYIDGDGDDDDKGAPPSAMSPPSPESESVAVGGISVALQRAFNRLVPKDEAWSGDFDEEVVKELNKTRSQRDVRTCDVNRPANINSLSESSQLTPLANCHYAFTTKAIRARGKGALVAPDTWTGGEIGIGDVRMEEEEDMEAMGDVFTWTTLLDDGETRIVHCIDRSGVPYPCSASRDGWVARYRSNGAMKSLTFQGQDGTAWFTWYFLGPAEKERGVMKVYYEGDGSGNTPGTVDWYKGETGHTEGAPVRYKPELRGNQPYARADRGAWSRGGLSFDNNNN